MSVFVSIGGITIDLYFQGDALTFYRDRFQLALGGKYFTDHFYQKIGGGGANVAIGVANHQIKSAVLGKIGANPFQYNIYESLKNHNVATDLVQVARNFINISTILLSKTGERSVINYNTPHQHLFDFRKTKMILAKADWVYLGNLPDVALTARTELLRYLRQNNVRVVVNLGINDCRRPIKQLLPFFQQIDYLIVNGHEFSEMVKAHYRDIHFQENVIEWYIPVLNHKTVVITEGKAGCFAYRYGQVFHQKAEPVTNVIDTNGVGDGFTAGFIAAMIKTGNLEKALKNGTRYAAKIIGKIGAN